MSQMNLPEPARDGPVVRALLTFFKVIFRAIQESNEEARWREGDYGYGPPPAQDIWRQQHLPRPVPGYGDPLLVLYQSSQPYSQQPHHGSFLNDRAMMQAQGYQPTSPHSQWMFRDGPLPGGPMWGS